MPPLIRISEKTFGSQSARQARSAAETSEKSIRAPFMLCGSAMAPPSRHWARREPVAAESAECGGIQAGIPHLGGLHQSHHGIEQGGVDPFLTRGRVEVLCPAFQVGVVNRPIQPEPQPS